MSGKIDLSHLTINYRYILIDGEEYIKLGDVRDNENMMMNTTECVLCYTHPTFSIREFRITKQLILAIEYANAMHIQTHHEEAYPYLLNRRYGARPYSLQDMWRGININDIIPFDRRYNGKGDSAVLIGFLMFGNLIRECGVLNALSETAQKVLANIITLLLGITIAAQMTADKFVQWETLLIIGLGLFAFIFDTVGGVMFAKLLNVFSKKKVNPMIGAAGISAFPMSSRVIHKMGLQEDPSNFLLMHAAGANVSGQIASVIAGGLLLALVG